MRTALLIIALAAVVFPVMAQAPSPEAQAFARLPADLQAALRHLPPHEALEKVAFARQNLIALGVPNPSPEQLRATVARVIGSGGVDSASAGASSFPPLSPLVSPYTPPLR